MWQHFLTRFIGWTPIISNRQCRLSNFFIFTDALANTDLGWGSFIPKTGQFSFGQWPKDWFLAFQPSIDCLELFAVLIMIFSLRHQLQNQRVTVFTDNTPTKEAIWNRTSPSKQMMLMLRALVITAVHFNIHIIPRYVRGSENKFADLLSHFRWRSSNTY